MTELQRHCSKCGQDKPLGQFYRDKTRNGFHRACKSCHAVVVRQYQKAKPEKRREWGRASDRRRRSKQQAYARKRLYGLSPEHFQRLFDQQEGRCAICRTELTKPCVDHDHDTQDVRGLLCSDCNTAIGLLKDDPNIVAAAAFYLCVSRLKRQSQSLNY